MLRRRSEDATDRQMLKAYLLTTEHYPQVGGRLCICWKPWPCPPIEAAERRLAASRQALTEATQTLTQIIGPAPTPQQPTPRPAWPLKQRRPVCVTPLGSRY